MDDSPIISEYAWQSDANTHYDHCIRHKYRRKSYGKKESKSSKNLQIAIHGRTLASAGINMPQFCTAFNDATKDRRGEIVPVVITAYEDKSFDFVTKTTPAAQMLKKAANIQKASGDQKQVAGTISVDQLKEIAEYKMPDLNANDVEAAMRIVAGTARNMGIKIEGFE